MSRQHSECDTLLLSMSWFSSIVEGVFGAKICLSSCHYSDVTVGFRSINWNISLLQLLTFRKLVQRTDEIRALVYRYNANHFHLEKNTNQTLKSHSASAINAMRLFRSTGFINFGVTRISSCVKIEMIGAQINNRSDWACRQSSYCPGVILPSEAVRGTDPCDGGYSNSTLILSQ